MPFVKGMARHPDSGRKPGQQNLTSQKLKEMVLTALQEQEGGAVEYLKQQAVKEPRAFMTLVGKLLPTQVTGNEGGPVEISFGWIED